MKKKREREEIEEEGNEERSKGKRTILPLFFEVSCLSFKSPCFKIS